MDNTIENTSNEQVKEDDIVVLGVASVETKGVPGSGTEFMGFEAGAGMIDE